MTRFWRWALIAWLFLLFGCGAAPREAPARKLLARPPGPGALVLIGGGEDDLPILRRFLALGGGPQARLVIAPLASGSPDGARYKARFEQLGVSAPVVLTGAASAREAELAALAEAEAIYFPGGLPDKLLSGFAPYREALKAAWRRGCAVGGHSAGAMVWGSRVIVSGEPEAAWRYGLDAARGGLAVSDGFGLLAGAIVDPHFAERDRFGRLWVASRATPALGIGLDERTAAVIGPDGTLEALGAGSVTLIRPEGEAARVALLRQGQRANLREWGLSGD